MMIICIFNVQTVLKKQPRLNLLGADLNMFSIHGRSPRKQAGVRWRTNAGIIGLAFPVPPPRCFYSWAQQHSLDPCEVEVHQHQKDAFSWLQFKRKLPDALYQPGFTLTNCEAENGSQEIGIRALTPPEGNVHTEFITVFIHWPVEIVHLLLYPK